GIVDVEATNAYNAAVLSGELPHESNEAQEEAELLQAVIQSVKEGIDPVTGQEISKAQGFGIISGLIFRYTAGGYKGKKIKIPKNILDKIKKSHKSKSILTSEMEAKILEGQRKGTTNGINGGHSSDINNNNPNFATETVEVNQDGTKVIKFTKQFPDGNISKIKTSTIFPEDWSDKDIIDSILKVSNSTAVGQRKIDGLTLHRGKVDGVEIDVIKKGNEIISGYPVGGKPTPGFETIK
ncbi:EndoU domain-containing protein, partial [Listeria innocua]|nr:EndoU domain-containing protein [Listeria innocua]